MYPYPYYSQNCTTVQIPVTGQGVSSGSRLVNNSHDLTNSLFERLDSIRDMLQMSTSASINSQNFGRNCQNFACNFSQTSSNAIQLVSSMKYPDFTKTKTPNPQPTFNESNCWSNINQDLEHIFGPTPQQYQNPRNSHYQHGSFPNKFCGSRLQPGQNYCCYRRPMRPRPDPRTNCNPFPNHSFPRNVTSNFTISTAKGNFEPEKCFNVQRRRDVTPATQTTTTTSGSCDTEQITSTIPTTTEPTSQYLGTRETISTLPTSPDTDATFQAEASTTNMHPVWSKTLKASFLNPLVDDGRKE